MNAWRSSGAALLSARGCLVSRHDVTDRASSDNRTWSDAKGPRMSIYACNRRTTMGRPTTDDLLRSLGDSANRPLSEATAMEPGLYRSEEILGLEHELIFNREWLC